MNKRVRKKNSKIHKKLNRRFSILYNDSENIESYKNLDLYKHVYFNKDYAYLLLDDKYYERLQYPIIIERGFGHISNADWNDYKCGEEFPLFWAIYHDKLPIYIESIEIMQYLPSGSVIEDKVLVNDENNRIKKMISDLFALSQKQGDVRHFPKHNEDGSINYRLIGITFLFKGYTFTLMPLCSIKTNAPNHIIDKLVQTNLLGYFRVERRKIINN